MSNQTRNSDSDEGSRHRRHWIRDGLLSLSVLSLTMACGAPHRDVTIEAQAPSMAPSRLSPTSSTTPTPSMVLPTPSRAPAPTRLVAPSVTPVLATPQFTTPPASPTPIYNPFAALTPLALTPSVLPEPLAPPQRLEIPKLGLDVPVYPVGVDKRGAYVVLKHDVAWYERSGMPTEGTNMVMWAHVLRFKATPNIPAPFARVHELEVGDQMTVTTAAGKRVRYVVTYQLRMRPDQGEHMTPTPLERLTLISCIGTRVIVGGEPTLAERLVTIAEPVQ